jgi:ComF family protein
MKFDNKRQASESISKILSEAGVDIVENSVLCPVPTAPSRIRQRGFDHTLLITNQLSKTMDLKSHSLLRRSTNTRQFGATRANRLKQMENEFYLNPKFNVEGSDIVLIDDVMTTGATLSSCAKVLKKAGAKSVHALIFAQKV